MIINSTSLNDFATLNLTVDDFKIILHTSGRQVSLTKVKHDLNLDPITINSSLRKLEALGIIKSLKTGSAERYLYINPTWSKKNIPLDFMGYFN